jgi:hypothetical protein
MTSHIIPPKLWDVFGGELIWLVSEVEADE